MDPVLPMIILKWSKDILTQYYVYSQNFAKLLDRIRFEDSRKMHDLCSL